MSLLLALLSPAAIDLTVGSDIQDSTSGTGSIVFVNIL